MTAIPTLEKRITAMERAGQQEPGDPFAHISDAELDVMCRQMLLDEYPDAMTCPIERIEELVIKQYWRQRRQ